MQYCVIVYVSHFWLPDFGPISVRSLLYTPKYLLFTLAYFLRLLLLVFYVRELGEHARDVKIRGGGRGHMGGKKLFADVRTESLRKAIYCAKPRIDAKSQSRLRSHRGLRSQAPRIICEYDLATTIAIWPLFQTCT